MEGSGDPKLDCFAWDKLAEEKGFDLSQCGAEYEESKIIGQRPFGPRKHASERCRSGKRNYCTCNTCF